jgi:DNA-binding NarL/FixJ family response regulator
MSRAVSSRSITPSSLVRVVVVDDHPVVRRGLVDLLNAEPGLHVCAEAASHAEALATVGQQKPDLVVIDLSLGTESGLDLVTALASTYPNVRLLVLSAHDEQLFAERAVRAGAHGYIMKAAPAEELIAALRRVAGGGHYVSEKALERLFTSLSGRFTNHDASAFDRLTDRERHVLGLVGKGLETKEIAAQLSLSVKTIETHYAHLKEKLGLKTGRELIRVAVGWAEGGFP